MAEINPDQPKPEVVTTAHLLALINKQKVYFHAVRMLLRAMLVDENRQVTNASYLVSRHGRQLSITRREVVETDIIPFD